MNQPSHRLRQEAREESSVTPLAEQQHSSSATAREFASVDEMIRHDAAGTPVPATVTERVRHGVAAEPSQPAGSWWKQFLGGTKL